MASGAFCSLYSLVGGLQRLLLENSALASPRPVASWAQQPQKEASTPTSKGPLAGILWGTAYSVFIQGNVMYKSF